MSNGWRRPMSAKMAMITRPITPILLAVNSPQFRRLDFRNSRSRMRHSGSWITGPPPAPIAGGSTRSTRSVTVGWSFPSLVADPRIQVHVEDVGDQVAEQGEDGDDRQAPHRQRDVLAN